MNRRNFINHTGTLASGTLVHAWLKKEVIKKAQIPMGLEPGDTIGLVTPGFFTSEEKLSEAIQKIQKLGFNYKKSKHLNKKHGYLAGTDQERASDLMEMFQDDEVKAIWCVRGGYGTARTLPYLDFKAIKRNPKILIGYSDITALHCALLTQSNLLSFHGPVATSAFTPYTENGFVSKVISAKFNAQIELSTENQSLGQSSKDFAYSVLNRGTATGQLVGGNLTLIASLVGTPYLPKFKNRIVFLEDIGEKPYRIDRMLNQLLQGTDIREASGIILGIFDDCAPNPDDEDAFTIHDIFKQLLIPLSIPTVYGFSFGHIDEQCTFPIGVSAKLDAQKGVVSLLERPIQ